MYEYLDGDNRAVSYTRPLSYSTAILYGAEAQSGPDGFYALIGIRFNGKRDVLGTIDGSFVDVVEVMDTVAIGDDRYLDFTVELRTVEE